MRANPYPGKLKTKLSREEYIDKEVEDWVGYFGDSQEYQNSLLSLKVKYLLRHLEMLIVNKRENKSKIARKLLVKAEVKMKGDLPEHGDYINHEEDHALNVDSGPEDMEVDTVGGNNYQNDSDKDMFEDEEEVEQERLSRRQRDAQIENILSKPDREIFEEKIELPEFLTQSRRFVLRKQKYIDKYMEDNFGNKNSQGILENLSQAPAVIQESKEIRNKLSHLSKEEKADRTALKAARDTISILAQTKGKAAREQVKVVTSALTHHKYGTPDLPGVSWRAKKEAKTMKMNLLVGSCPVLEPPVKPKKHVYPEEIENIVTEHWMQNTILEPALHRKKAKQQEKESVPIRYQTLTDKEQYAQFKEDCSESITDIMRSFGEEHSAKISQWPESLDRTRRLSYYSKIHTKFPSIDFYIGRKPEEVKPLHDHTTALCRTCEAAQLNWQMLVKTVPMLCQCGTRECPNWVCMCRHEDTDDDTEDDFDGGTCSCSCECPDCKKCKVSISENVNIITY